MVDDIKREKWRRRRRRRKIHHYVQIIGILILIGTAVYGSTKIYGKGISNTPKEDETLVTIKPTDKLDITKTPDDKKEEKLTTVDDKNNSEEIKDTTKYPDTTEETKKPEVMRKPEVMKKPEETMKPEVSKEPEVKKKTEVTKEPETTKEPEITKTPEITKKPEVTKAQEIDDDSFFDDAVFIGDSRTGGFGIYSELKNATFYAENGLMVNTVLTHKVANVDGQSMTILDALKKRSFKKVYIMFGVNELGWPYENIFIDKYSKIIEAIKKAQPEAEIYVQSIIHINTKKVRKAHSYLNNVTINKRNTLIKKMAEDNEVNYLNLNHVLSDSTGNLIFDASSDGIHLNKQYCIVWKQYLLEHK